MEDLRIEATEFTPEIHFDATQGILNLSGDSYHDRTLEVFKPVVAWVQEFVEKTELKEVTVNFKMAYYNTITSRRFLDILDLMENFEAKGGRKVIINWYYTEKDSDMLESGREFADDTQLQFNYEQLPKKDVS